MTIKRQSIASRINLILGSISAVILVFSITIIYLSSQISNATERVADYDLPEALNTLAMLEELGDMNSNLLEYMIGEEEEQQEYFSNFDEFIRFRQLIPKDIKEHNTIEQVVRLVEGHKNKAINQVFEVYNPMKERQAAEQINYLIKNVGVPLERLLDVMKDEEIADVGKSINPQEVIDDHLTRVRFSLELTDEAGDMLSDLNRFVLADSDAERDFFANAMQFENYLVQLKPLEVKPHQVIRITEIERLFQELKKGGIKVFNEYHTRNKIAATKAIDDLEHQTFTESERIGSVQKSVSFQ